MVKICKSCNFKKPIVDFHKNKYSPDGHTTKCKFCRNLHNKKDYYDNIKARKLTKKIWRENNPDYFKKWHQNNPAYNQQYFKKNSDYHKLWARNARINNLQRKLSERLRDRVRSVVVGSSRAGSAVKDLGCSLEQFKLHMESRFQDGMNWENYGKWHIDHVKPLSLFDLSDRKQFLEACHFSNLQPLWAEDNLKKGNNYNDQ